MSNFVKHFRIIVLYIVTFKRVPFSLQKLPYLHLLSSIILALYTSTSSALETPEPSSLLRPRDINPHPYDNAYDGVSIFDKNLIINSEKFMQNLLKYDLSTSRCTD